MLRVQKRSLKFPCQRRVIGVLLIITTTLSVYYGLYSLLINTTFSLRVRNVTNSTRMIHQATDFASSAFKNKLTVNVDSSYYGEKSNTITLMHLTHEKLMSNVSLNINNTLMSVYTCGANHRFKHTFENRFISCPDPVGRLGNMMFQLAATVAIARTLKYTPAISQNNPAVKYFNLTTVKIFPKRLNATLKIRQGEWMEGNWTGKHPDYMCHNLTISGLFQTWKVFNSIPREIKGVFSVKPEHLIKAKSFLYSSVPKAKTIIGFHVRRGDFLQPHKQERGRVVADKNYTTAAMNFYRQRYKNAHFVVCSDDMKWCKENIEGPDVTYSNFTQPIVDMSIMSLCDHMIITGGTFGWWSAWLSGGTVVYLNDFPRPGSALDTRDFRKMYYPAQWIGICNGE